VTAPTGVLPVGRGLGRLRHGGQAAPPTRRVGSLARRTSTTRPREKPVPKGRARSAGYLTDFAEALPEVRTRQLVTQLEKLGHKVVLEPPA
jgi:uncharacterized FAD-dependent dehydrogenase